MKNHLPRFAFSALLVLSISAAVAMLAACNSGGSVPSAPLGASQPDLGRSVNLGFLDIGNYVGTETLSGNMSVTCNFNQLVFKAGDQATGPYPGTFAAIGQSERLPPGCGSGSHTIFSESFSISSGVSAVGGSAGWFGNFFCIDRNECFIAKSGLTYSAKLIRGGKVRKKFSGSGSQSGSSGRFVETLNSL